MGMFRDTECQEIDLVKEMAEALGSTGLRLEEVLERVQAARTEVEALMNARSVGEPRGPCPDDSLINEQIRRHNELIDKAEDARRWLLIQREACGFRVHRDVDLYYPIPAKIKLIR
jgi:hypothetical protein